MADANGVVNPNGPIEDLSVPYGQLVNPVATTSGSVVGNIPSETLPGESLQTGITMYDSQGVPQKVFYNFTKARRAPTPGRSTSCTSDGTVLLSGDRRRSSTPSGALTTPARRPGDVPDRSPRPPRLPELDRGPVHHRPVRR